MTEDMLPTLADLEQSTWSMVVEEAKTLARVGVEDNHQAVQVIYNRATKWINSQLVYPDRFNVRISLGENGPIGVHITERSAVERLGDLS